MIRRMKRLLTRADTAPYIMSLSPPKESRMAETFLIIGTTLSATGAAVVFLKQDITQLRVEMEALKNKPAQYSLFSCFNDNSTHNSFSSPYTSSSPHTSSSPPPSLPLPPPHWVDYSLMSKTIE
eukprot:TRINITY_DN15117_c0_g1_i1.p1 TRINITY_DN15117_c0_g1~~TRINITY_DN15117_c0_g1_i1.p1  ORF type:complete len:124 (-),score=29.72 TRINITY_DN15117_c0_g1_i1:211-582(-)